jgi:hypothetical protein
MKRRGGRQVDAPPSGPGSPMLCYSSPIPYSHHHDAPQQRPTDYNSIPCKKNVTTSYRTSRGSINSMSPTFISPCVWRGYTLNVRCGPFCSGVAMGSQSQRAIVPSERWISYARGRVGRPRTALEGRSRDGGELLKRLDVKKG